METLKDNTIINVVKNVSSRTGVSAYLVGGAVRDYVKNGSCGTDLDFVVISSLDTFVSSVSDILKGKVIVWNKSDRRLILKEKGKYIHVDFSVAQGGTIYEDLKKSLLNASEALNEVPKTILDIK